MILCFSASLKLAGTAGFFVCLLKIWTPFGATVFLLPWDVVGGSLSVLRPRGRHQTWLGITVVGITPVVLLLGLALRSSTSKADGPGNLCLNAGAAGNPYGRWEKGPPSDPGWFPIAVWLQAPKNAVRYKEAGFNLYVGLWKGPTEEQLSALREVGMPVICEQNDVGLAHRDDDLIVGWMHGDEPDNAQSLGPGQGYGPPIPPERIIANYQSMKERDPSRPMLLNLGQGVAWDGWYGRGVRTNHPEDYPEYIKGCDLVSFDIYPVVHSRPEVAGKLWFVPRGIDRLREWSQDAKIVWNCIECTRISNTKVKPTPHQVRAEVWMSLIHGSMGLIYFAHQFQPQFLEAGLLADPEMLEGVTRLNTQIRELAPVLNSPSLANIATASSQSADVLIDIMVKRHEGSLYVFTVAMRDGQTRGAFQVADLPAQAAVEVIGEDRRLRAVAGRFEDHFAGYDVHLYRIPIGG